MIKGKLGVTLVIVLLVGLIAGLVAGCDSTKDVLLEEPGQSYELNVGDTATLELAENLTTGYSWQVTADDETILTTSRDEYLEPDTGKNPVVGAAGTHIWEFKAVKAGTVNLTFALYRPWEGKDSAAETRVYTITAK